MKSGKQCGKCTFWVLSVSAAIYLHSDWSLISTKRKVCQFCISVFHCFAKCFQWCENENSRCLSPLNHKEWKFIFIVEKQNVEQSLEQSVKLVKFKFKICNVGPYSKSDLSYALLISLPFFCPSAFLFTKYNLLSYAVIQIMILCNG